MSLDGATILSQFCPTALGQDRELRLFFGCAATASPSVQVGLLTIYDMCKAADRGMVMTNVRVLEKHGGKSGDWTAETDQ